MALFTLRLLPLWKREVRPSIEDLQNRCGLPAFQAAAFSAGKAAVRPRAATLTTLHEQMQVHLQTPKY
jgi:hypothetical protein